MNLEELKNLINAQEPTFLQEAKRIAGKQTYVCPKCGNGSGESGDGITPTTVNGHKHYKCFRQDCSVYADVIELYQMHTGISDFMQAVKDLCKLYHIDTEGYSFTGEQSNTHTTTQPYNNTHDYIHTQSSPIPAQDNHVQLEDFTDYYAECNARAFNIPFYKNRGITEETIKRFNLGFDPNYSKGTGGAIWPGLIIPTGPNSYVVRNGLPAPKPANRYRKCGPSRLFNLEGVKESALPIFITEGEFDALSVLEVGYDAIGLGSTQNTGQLLKELETWKPKAPLILALDNDEAGIKTTKSLSQALTRMEIPYILFEGYGTCKDMNDLLLKNRSSLGDSLYQSVNEARAVQEEIKKRIKEEYMQNAVSSHLDKFLNGISPEASTPCVPTGFSELDDRLDGGLYEGLYVIGAMSSLGKTTFMLQIADQIAQAGTDVLFFSMEQARTELIAKSLSRLTLIEAKRQGLKSWYALDIRHIMNGTLPKTIKETELLNTAVEEYRHYADRLFIYEGVGDINITQITQTIKRHIEVTGNKPIVFIDYLQIIAPYDPRSTDKQNTDRAVLELKRLSRSLKLTVIAISSFNRDNYKKPVNMASFKESGAIEYTSDVLFGLQFAGTGKKGFDIEEAKNRSPRQVMLKVLKNRNGQTGSTLRYNYFADYQLFTQKFGVFEIESAAESEE